MLKVRRDILGGLIPTLVVLIKFVAATSPNHEGLTQVGDMWLTQEQMSLFDNNSSAGRNGYVDMKWRWPKATVPISFSSLTSYSVKQRVKEAAEVISKATCVKFLFSEDFPPYFPPEFKNRVNAYEIAGKRCFATTGYTAPGVKPPSASYRFLELNADPTVCRVVDVIHELMHVLGFFHMNLSPDRDNYVTIDWGNVMHRDRKDLEIIKDDVTRFGTKYDYNSITHDGPYTSSKDPKKLKTIIPKALPDNHNYGVPALMGDRVALTLGDVTRINKMYNCP